LGLSIVLLTFAIIFGASLFAFRLAWNSAVRVISQSAATWSSGG
jgi:hypothetical protein